MQRRDRRSFSKEFKREAAGLIFDQGYFVPEACKAMDVGRTAINRWVQQLIFLNYSWPGNIRELKSTIHYACALCPEEVIQKEHLPPELFSENAPRSSTGSKSDLKDTDHTSQGSEKKAILTALEKTGWNKAKTARRLGVSRATLYNKLLKYGIETQPDKS